MLKPTNNNNNLRGIRVYLGGNIENSIDPYGWRNELTSELSKLGIICLDPTKNILENHPQETEYFKNNLRQLREKRQWKKIKKLIEPIISRDLRAIDISDVIIFRLEPDKPTWGTVHELVVSLNQKKPVLILIDDMKRFPIWFAGLINMNMVFEKIENLIKYFCNINNGTVIPDPHYWKFLLKELR